MSIVIGEKAKQKLLEGVNLVGDAVKPTLGPKAKTVVLKERGHAPIVINDGVTIAKAVYSNDEFVQMGVELVRQVASQAQEMSGDGTTTATIIAQRLCNSSYNYDTTALTKQLNQDLKLVLKELDDMSYEVDPKKWRERLQSVATIAANNDEELGELVAKVVSKVGVNGTVTVENSLGFDTFYEMTEGMELESGYISRLMINNKDKNTCELENPLVLLTANNIEGFADILPALEHSNNEKRPLLIICADMKGAALPSLLVNVMKGTINCCVIKVPAWGDMTWDILEDIQALTGGKIYQGPIDDMDFGTLQKVSISNDKTVITNTDIDIDERISYLTRQIENEENTWKKEQLQVRVNKLLGGVCVVKAGAHTEAEMRDKRERLDDAINATKAALDEGVVYGGGKALYVLGSTMDIHPLLSEAMKEPMRQLIKNSGLEVEIPDIVGLDNKIGFNANTNEFCDIWDDGIIDPVKVTKNSLITAVSIAGLILSAEVLVGETPYIPDMPTMV
ncbi:MAG: chaperonin GroEL [Euryarchaeota archaeon]|nr:chaperonin GroEL [Euryarchaeota archaeon]